MIQVLVFALIVLKNHTHSFCCSTSVRELCLTAQGVRITFSKQSLSLSFRWRMDFLRRRLKFDGCPLAFASQLAHTGYNDFADTTTEGIKAILYFRNHSSLYDAFVFEFLIG